MNGLANSIAQEQAQRDVEMDCHDGPVFGVLGPRCWTGPSMLDCHVLKGFGIYMIGILGSLC